MPAESHPFAWRDVGGVGWYEDTRASEMGAVVAFSARHGGVSLPPYESLNLAGHVGDDPVSVDTNRERLLECLGIDRFRSALTTAEQVHGDRVVTVTEQLAGSGASVTAGREPVPQCDALTTLRRGVPLMLFFADCVPVVLVAPGPAIAVVHAGWKGALASLPGKAASNLAVAARCAPARIVASIGPHIGPCHYQVGPEILSQFVHRFDTFARAESGGLDLGAVVTASLIDAGVLECNIAALGVCTSEATDRFFSYRAEDGLTGRHAAVACIVP